MFSADEDARREEDGVDGGIELSSLNRRDSGNESVLVVEEDGISSIIKHVRAWQRIDPPSWWILWIFVRTKWSPAPEFMLLRNENVINFTTKSIA